MVASLNGAPAVAHEIRRRLLNVKRGSLAVFGDIFGGRIDHIHIATAAHTEPGRRADRVVNDGEILSVWQPRGAVVAPRHAARQRDRCPLAVAPPAESATEMALWLGGADRTRPGWNVRRSPS
jgi:hypothetical protein